MKANKPKIFFNGLQWFFSGEKNGLTLGQKIVLISILSLFEAKDIITKKDIIKANKANIHTTYSNIRALEAKGFIKSTRSNQFYSLSYISLTEKGNLFASRLRRILSQS